MIGTERRYWKKIGEQWVNFFDRKERKVPEIGQSVQIIPGIAPRKITNVVWLFKPGKDKRGFSVFDCFDVYVT
jgi:hypothetical protein